MASVRLKNVSKNFGNVKALSGIDIEIKDKEFTVLVGPSGCGKSTLLRIIAGLENPSRGEVFIGEKLVNDLHPRDRNVAMVFQDYALYPHLSVFENIAFGLKARKTPRKEIKKNVEEAAELLSMSEYLGRKPKELSGGQRQRVALGRAIVRKPKVFLFDEPLSNLDAKLRVHMRAELKRLQEKLRVTSIYVTHDQTEAMAMGDRIAVMKEGVIQQINTPLNVFQKPSNKFVVQFIGSPPVNLFTARLVKNSEGVILAGQSFKINLGKRVSDNLSMYDGSEILCGLRPTDIFLKPSSEKIHLFNTESEFIENLGTDIYLYSTLGKNRFTVRIPKGADVRPGEKISIYAELSKIYFFDTKTGQVI